MDGAAQADLAGLGLVELLDRLHDVVSPEAVSALPTAPGWAVLALWALVAVILVRVRSRRARARDAYRAAALAELARIEAGDGPVAEALAVVMKRTALAAFPRAEVATLSGERWAAFLVESADGDAVVAEAAPQLARAAFAPDVDGRALLRPARRWIEVHRA